MQATNDAPPLYPTSFTGIMLEPLGWTGLNVWIVLTFLFLSTAIRADAWGMTELKEVGSESQVIV